MNHIPELQLVSVLYRGADERIAGELQRLAELVGLDFQATAAGEHVIDGILVFQSVPHEPWVVRAHFHEMFVTFFARGVAKFHVRDDAGDIMALMSSVGVTVRGNIIGVVGAHGGAGTTTTAAWLARLAQGEASAVALADFGVGAQCWEVLLGLEPGYKTREVVAGARGALLPGKLADSLASWHGVRVLPGGSDFTGGGFAGGGFAWAANEEDAMRGQEILQALAQVHSWTILDFGVLGSHWSAQQQWLENCDLVVMVTHTSPVDTAVCQAKQQILGVTHVPVVVANAVSSVLEADQLAVDLSNSQVLPVRRLRSARGDMDHALAPGDRTRGKTAKDMQRLWQALKEAVA